MTGQYKDFIKRLEGVSAEDFFSFLDEKGVSYVCPICDVDGQNLAETNKVNAADPTKGITFVTYFKYHASNGTDSDENYFYKLTCANCGFISTYSVTSVLNWLDKNKQKGKDS